jgi:hypothetical protein
VCENTNTYMNTKIPGTLSITISGLISSPSMKALKVVASKVDANKNDVNTIPMFPYAASIPNAFYN